MQPLLPRSEYFATLHRIPAAAGALFFDEQGRLLILKTTYRDGYLIPGGMIEKNESPQQACLREVEEELHLKLPVGMLLCVDYKPQSETTFNDETYQFMFDGGILTSEQIQAIQLDPEEHIEFLFAPIEEALTLCSPKLARRLPFCLQARDTQTFVYLENGKPHQAGGV